MTNTVEKDISKKSIMPLAQCQSSLVNQDKRLMTEIFGILDIKLPDCLQQDNLNINTFIDLLSNYLQKEEETLSAMFSVCTASATYEDIKCAKTTITAKKEHYVCIRTQCYNLYQLHNDEVELSCPFDSTLTIRNYSLVVTDSTEKMLVWNDGIKNTSDVLKAIICKFEHLAYVCDILVKTREELSASNQYCLAVYNQFMTDIAPLIKVAAQKIIEDKITTKAQREKHEQKINKRIHNGVFSEQVENYFYKPTAFAYYCANTEGIDASKLYDFVIDVEILQQLQCHSLLYPWVKTEYHKQINDIVNMVAEAYCMLANSSIKIPPTHAYAIIWLWLTNSLKIADAKARNAVPSFTAQLNVYTQKEFKQDVIHNEISKMKNQNLVNHYNILNALAYKYGVISL